MSSLKESMNLAGRTSQLLNQVRRDMMKPNLPKQFSKLATENDEASEFLFGTSVCDRIESLTKENKLTSLLERDRGHKRKYDESKKEPSSNNRPSFKSYKRTTEEKGQKQKSYKKPRPSPPKHYKKKH